MSKAAEKKRRHEKQEKIAMEARARALAHMKTKNVQSHAEIIAPVPKNARNHRDNTLELVRKRKAKQMQAQTVEDVAKKQRLEAATQNANNVPAPAPAPTPTPTLPPPQASIASSVQTTKVIPKGPTWHDSTIYVIGMIDSTTFIVATFDIFVTTAVCFCFTRSTQTC